MFDIFRTLFKYKEKESPDEMGFFPEKVHVEALPERRYLWTSRFLVIISGLSICFNMMLACSIYLMLPMLRVTPQFFTINKYFNQIEQVQQQEIRYPVSDLVTEQYIQEYIMLRYSMLGDLSDILENWDIDSPIYWYSSTPVYEDFRKTDIPANLLQYRRDGLERYVVIQWIRPLSRGLWQTQFQTYEITKSHPEAVVTNWRATMRIAYMRMDSVSREDRINNPYGFLVLSYSLAYRGLEGNMESYIDTARRLSRGQ